MKKILSLIFLLNMYVYSSSLEVGLGSLKFNYTEYNDSGKKLNSEKNTAYEFNGGFITYNHGLEQYRNNEQQYNQTIEINYNFHFNTTDYDGQLQNGTPHQTKTDNELHQGHLRYRAINKINNNEVGIFLGLGYRYWDRDILGAGGYLETYQWPYYEAGLSWKWYDLNFFTGFDISYQKAYKPTMKAYINGGLDFDLGETKGYKIDVPFGYTISENVDITLHYIYDKWNIAKSNILPTSTGIAWEPDSVTKNQYAYISLKYAF